ncbi:MAG TPA: four helix bundle protein [Candidatus Omnitrophota bacterium]|nr:four helix bundle protein [Candidatus Omnitrophota bacterium]HPD85638.1 four helix bundle protein [Candidatus Omnitrophota bacterium]HRZ04481.1 four helix bundle protein [Candidatus Omnitrophota bacterium]
MKVKDYKDLKIWQKGIEIAEKIYFFTDQYPKSELFILTTQMRRAAVSIPSNIAEGFVRHHTKEYTQFLYISLGSCAELETQIILSGKRQYLSEVNSRPLVDSVIYEMRMILSLIKKL